MKPKYRNHVVLEGDALAALSEATLSSLLDAYDTGDPIDMALSDGQVITVQVIGYDTNVHVEPGEHVEKHNAVTVTRIVLWRRA